MPNVLDSRGFRFRYSSGIAPLVTTKEYTDLIKNYKTTGQFPHILKLGGMAIDTSRNRNKWRVPMGDLQAIADQLKGAPLMKDHDIDHVDSIIGKVEEAWVEPNKDDPEAGKVMWAGQTNNESLIQKILLGYVRFNSIQIAVPRAYCDNCMSANGKSEEQAAIDNLDEPCPRCGSLDMLIRQPMVLEQSMVAIPAYEKAEVAPYGFKASLDQRLQKRFERANLPKVVQPAQPDLLPILSAASLMVGELTLLAGEMQLRMMKAGMEGENKCRCDEFYPDQCPSCLAKSQNMGMADTKDEDEEAGPEIGELGMARYSQEEHRILRHGGRYAECPECFPTRARESGYLREESKGDSLEDESDQNTCSECGGPLMELGSLGSRTHYRCRNCGMDFSSGSKEETQGSKGGSIEDFPLVQKGKKEAGSSDELSIDSSGQPYKCPVCGRNDVVSHSNFCYSEFMRNPNKYTKEEGEEVSEIYCPDCSFHTPDDEAFKKHTIQAHGWDAENPDSWGASD
jgi:hypothetical protein